MMKEQTLENKAIKVKSFLQTGVDPNMEAQVKKEDIAEESELNLQR